jgi:hypothetical protein
MKGAEGSRKGEETLEERITSENRKPALGGPGLPAKMIQI